MASDVIYVGGSPIACSAPVSTWKDRPELGFSELKHRPATRAVCWHHTGGSGLAHRVHATLVARRLSCHFVIEPDGAIVQFCDTETRAQHAGLANGFSVGVEVVNPAASTTRPGKPPRDVVCETIHGVEGTATTCTYQQLLSALALAETLELAYDLPRAVPMLRDDVYATVVPGSVMARFRGHIAHFMLNRHKRDPGLVLMKALAAQPSCCADGVAE